jgi:AraC family transcriptional regulator of adaptative response / DNA-3-methyladenine glycosylase II
VPAPSAAARARPDPPLYAHLFYRPPYDWPHVAAFLATRAVPGVECVDAAGYARTVRCGAGHATIRVRPVPGKDGLELQIEGAGPESIARLTGTARRMFDLDADPRTIGRHLGRDPLLAPLILRHPGLRIPGIWDPFEAAVRAVLGQQVSVAAGRTFAARLVRLAGSGVGAGTGSLTHLFPSPGQIAAADLGAIGLTRARARTLHALARATAEGAVDFSGAPAALAAALVALPGIGPWTAQYVLLRGRGEADALPEADLVLRRMAAPPGDSLSGPQLTARARAWQPWRGYAVIHLWRAAAAAQPRSDGSAVARTRAS